MLRVAVRAADAGTSTAAAAAASLPSWGLPCRRGTVCVLSGVFAAPAASPSGSLPSMPGAAVPVLRGCETPMTAAQWCAGGAAGLSTASTAKASHHRFGRANPAHRRKRFNLPDATEQRSRGYDYEWVVVAGGQRMLARAPAGTKRWHLWASASEVSAKALRQRRHALQGTTTWLVDASGVPLK